MTVAADRAGGRCASVAGVAGRPARTSSAARSSALLEHCLRAGRWPRRPRPREHGAHGARACMLAARVACGARLVGWRRSRPGCLYGARPRPGRRAMPRACAAASAPVLANKYYVDEIYDALVVRPLQRLSPRRLEARRRERDRRRCVNGTAWSLASSPAALTLLQTGNVQQLRVTDVRSACSALARGCHATCGVLRSGPCSTSCAHCGVVHCWLAAVPALDRRADPAARAASVRPWSRLLRARRLTLGALAIAVAASRVRSRSCSGCASTRPRRFQLVRAPRLDRRPRHQLPRGIDGISLLPGRAHRRSSRRSCMLALVDGDRERA